MRRAARRPVEEAVDPRRPRPAPREPRPSAGAPCSGRPVPRRSRSDPRRCARPGSGWPRPSPSSPGSSGHRATAADIPGSRPGRHRRGLGPLDRAECGVAMAPKQLVVAGPMPQLAEAEEEHRARRLRSVVGPVRPHAKHRQGAATHLVDDRPGSSSVHGSVASPGSEGDLQCASHRLRTAHRRLPPAVSGSRPKNPVNFGTPALTTQADPSSNGSSSHARRLRRSSAARSTAGPTRASGDATLERAARHVSVSARRSFASIGARQTPSASDANTSRTTHSPCASSARSKASRRAFGASPSNGSTATGGGSTVTATPRRRRPGRRDDTCRAIGGSPRRRPIPPRSAAADCHSARSGRRRSRHRSRSSGARVPRLIDSLRTTIVSAMPQPMRRSMWMAHAFCGSPGPSGVPPARRRWRVVAHVSAVATHEPIGSGRVPSRRSTCRERIRVSRS